MNSRACLLLAISLAFFGVRAPQARAADRGEPLSPREGARAVLALIGETSLIDRAARAEHRLH